MRPEDVARRHQFREGFILIDYAEVGLPVIRLTIEAVTTSFRSISAIQEFVMRCMSLGEGNEANIARMLGLKSELIEGAMNGIVTDGFATRILTPGEEPLFRLTEGGEKRLAEEREEVAQEEMLVIDYDGIRRMPIRLTGESVVRAAELKMLGAVEIRPYPAEPPAVSELSIPEVSQVIRRQRGEEFRRTVLALKRIIRRSNLYREAVALVYASKRGSEVQVAFAIDGELSDIHERTFAERGGPRKMGFLRAVESNPRKRLERLVGKDLTALMPDDALLEEIRRVEAEARQEAQIIRPAAQAERRSSTNPAAAALLAAEERLAIARHELDSLPVRPMAAFEQDELLEEALRGTRHSLLITSAGLWPSLVNGFMLREIDRLKAEGVEIEIATFLPPSAESRGGDIYDPLAELSKRAKRETLKLVQVKRCDHFFLIQDDELAVVANRPFLGEVYRRTGFQRVEGLVVRSRDLVRQVREIASNSVEVRRG